MALDVRTAAVIRPVAIADRAPWAELFRGYRAFYQLEPDESVIGRVWDWLGDDSHEVSGFVAELDGVLVGLAHYSRFARPSSGSAGIYLDDLFTAPEARGCGVGRALLLKLRALAAAERRTVVRWITAEDNRTARRLYDSVASPTPWITYDMAPVFH